MVFHPSKCAGYGERPLCTRLIVPKVPCAAQETPIADSGLKGGVVSLEGRVGLDERLFLRIHRERVRSVAPLGS